MILYIGLTAIFINYICSLVYPLEHEIIVNIIENKKDILKENIKSRVINVGYNCFYSVLYYYSLLQININKYANKSVTICRPYISTLWIAIINCLKEHKIIENKQKINIIGIYKNGTIVNEIKTTEMKVDNLLNTFEVLTNKNNYDFIILSDKKDEYEYVNKIHYTEFPETINDYKNSTLRFFAVELEYKDVKHSINLINEKDNHYIVNNVLNKEFFKYYLTNILNLEIDNYNFDYNVSVIDHNVNVVKLTQDDYLVIKEDDYEINTNTNTNTDLNNNSINKNEDSNNKTDELDDKNYDGDLDDKNNDSDEYIKLE